MVQMMKPDGSRPDRDVTTTSSSFSSAASKVKREILDDPSEDPRRILSKRPKTSSLAVEEYNPLNEPSPLGLSLRKSPSLLDLIQMRLSQGNAQKIEDQGIAPSKKESKSVAGPTAVDKLKASNFPGSLLKIGAWEYKSRYEGDLVAKCYFAKHKLVWEILEGGLKSKIEIQWSDIMAMKANCSEDEPGTLNVLLARQPLFFRETNPQPRKHTLWQATADFTKGQASIHRQHFLECPPGLLTKHFEKLIQCDMRLNFLSRQPEISLDSPYFEQRASVFEDPLDLKTQVEAGKGPSLSGLEDLASPSAAPSSSYEHEKRDPAGSSSAPISHEPLSPISADERGNCDAVDSKMTRDWEQIKVPGFHPSMSMSDLMNHIGNCLTEQRTAGNLSISADGSERDLILEDIAQYLLSDTQLTSSSDDKRLMARVNSLYCLLQKDPGSTQNLQALGESYAQESDRGIGVQLDQAYELPSSSDEKRLMARVNSLYCLLQKDPGSTQNLQALGESLAQESDRGIGVQLDQAYELPSSITSKNKPDLNNPEDNTKDASCSKPVLGMSRKDSFGDLLLHLPRIASLPKFLFNISE